MEKKKRKSRFLSSHLVYSILVCVCVCACKSSSSPPPCIFSWYQSLVRQEGALGSKQEAVLGQELHHLFPLVDYYTLGGSTSGGVGKKSPIEELSSQAYADRDSA